MKLLKLVSSALLFMTLALPAFSQSGPPAPSSGIWAIIDTNYTVGTSTLNVTKARITLQNTTVNKTTGVQFRVFYDKIAFHSKSKPIECFLKTQNFLIPTFVQPDGINLCYFKLR